LVADRQGRRVEMRNMNASMDRYADIKSLPKYK
jgi:hypothetical protein